MGNSAHILYFSLNPLFYTHTHTRACAHTHMYIYLNSDDKNDAGVKNLVFILLAYTQESDNKIIRFRSQLSSEPKTFSMTRFTL